MIVNRDPDKPSPVSDELIKSAFECRLQVANFICHDELDTEAVTFAACVPFLPRPADLIKLQDETICEVEKVIFNVVTPRPGIAAMMPNVVSKVIKRKEVDEDG